MNPIAYFLTGAAFALVVFAGFIVLCALCVSGDKANDSEHTEEESTVKEGGNK